MNRIAKALYTVAMAQNDETLALIERRFGKGENYIKTCREMHISPITYSIAEIFHRSLFPFLFGVKNLKLIYSCRH